MIVDVSEWDKTPLFPELLPAWANLLREAVSQHSSRDLKLRGNQYLYNPDTSSVSEDELFAFVEEKWLQYVKTVDGKDLFKITAAKLVKVVDHPMYPEFINQFNMITGKKSRGDKASKRAFGASFEKYGMQEILRAVTAASKDNFHKDNGYLYLTPEYILRDKILDRYLSIPQTAINTSSPQFSGN